MALPSHIAVLLSLLFIAGCGGGAGSPVKTSGALDFMVETEWTNSTRSMEKKIRRPRSLHDHSLRDVLLLNADGKRGA